MAAESARKFEALEAQAATLLDVFRRGGYEQVAPSIIQPADIFLDQIGEEAQDSRMDALENVGLGGILTL